MQLRHLLVIDQAQRGFELLHYAALMAERNRATLRVVHWAPSDVGASLAPDSTRDRLEHRAVPLRARGIEVTTGFVRGGCESIVREALRCGADLVVKLVERRERFAQCLRPSPDRRLVRNCPCPVWLVREASLVGGSVLAAVNPQDDDAAGAALDARILHFASRMADWLDADLHVVHAWWVPRPLLGRASVSPEWNRRALEEEGAAAAAARVAHCLARATMLLERDRIHLVRGDPRIVLPDVASEIGAQVLVAGHVGRTGLAGLLFGSVSEQLLSRMGCSLLVLRAEPSRRSAPLDAPVGSAQLRPARP